MRSKGVPFTGSVTTLPRELVLKYESALQSSQIQLALRPDNSLLTKTQCTAHVPLPNRSKEARRAYANFDKEIAARLFGYRVDFNPEKMKISEQDPCQSQHHKPLVRYVADVVSELTSGYAALEYATK